MAIEAGSFGFPNKLQTAVEVEKIAVPLRENCISILETHGVLERSRGLRRVFVEMGIVDLLGYRLKAGLARKERLARRIYRAQINVKDREEPFEVEIISLGETSPRDAKHLLIGVDSLFPGAYLDIGKRKAVLRPGRPGGDIMGPSFYREVSGQQLADYSKMITIAKENLPRMPRS